MSEARNRRWLLVVVGRSLKQRLARTGVALLSVTVLCTTLVAGVAVSTGVRAQLGHELAVYGANVLLAPTSGTLPGQVVDQVLQVEGVDRAAGQLFAPARVEDLDVEVLGVDPRAMVDLGWHLEGRWPEGSQAVLGSDLDAALGEQDRIRLVLGGQELDLQRVGHFETGGTEDRAVLVDLGLLQQTLGQGEVVSAVLVRASGEVDATVQLLAGRFPEARVTTVQQVASTEQRLLSRMELLTALALLVVLLGTVVAMSSTMSALVIERRAELGLMRALGAERGTVRALFLGEATVIGAIGGLFGTALGALSALAVTGTAFSSAVHLSGLLVGVGVLAGVGLSLAATLYPLTRALSKDPVTLLRNA